MKRIYIDMDHVICDFAKGCDKWRDAGFDGYPQSKYGFFLNLEPIKDAVESVNFLREHFDVYILSRPSIMNPHSYMEKALWIENHFGHEFLKKLILSCNKSLVIGDYLIDDHTADGQLEFKGELIQFGTGKYPDWRTVNSYIVKETGLKLYEYVST